MKITWHGQSRDFPQSGPAILDYQMIAALREMGAKGDGRYAIGSDGNGRASLCYQARTPSGKLSARIQEAGRIQVEGMTYQMVILGSKATWIWAK